MMNLWHAKRSVYIMALSAVAVAVGLGAAGLGTRGQAPRTQASQAVPSPARTCTPPCGQSVVPQALPLLRARQAAAVRLAGSVHAQRPPAPKLLAKSPPTPPAPKPPIVTIDGRHYRVLRTLSMIASVYGLGDPGVNTITATGTHVHLGEVAVDPRVIPLDTWMYIQGYRSPFLPKGGMLAHAEDTGGAIKGMRVDIFMNAPRYAYGDFGLQRVRVQILAPMH